MDMMAEVDKTDKARIEKEKDKASRAEAEQEKAKAQAQEDDPFGFEEELEAGDQFMAVKPWKGAIVAPSGYSGQIRGQDKAPDVTIEPVWCYGYRGGKAKNNI
jgi:microtubule-associated protein-like 6